MDWSQTLAIVGAVGMFLTGVGGLIVSLLGMRAGNREKRAQTDNVAVDTASDALLMAREVWREKITEMERRANQDKDAWQTALEQERALRQEMQRRIEEISAELQQVRASQTEAAATTKKLQALVAELEQENNRLRAFVEQLKLHNEALSQQLRKSKARGRTG